MDGWDEERRGVPTDFSALVAQHGYPVACPHDTIQRSDWRMPLVIASWIQGESSAEDSHTEKDDLFRIVPIECSR